MAGNRRDPTWVQDSQEAAWGDYLGTVLLLRGATLGIKGIFLGSLAQAFC